MSTYVLIAGFLLLQAALLAGGLRKQRVGTRHLEKLAPAYGGRVSRESWLAYAVLDLTVEDVPGHLSYHPGRGSQTAFTRITFDWRPAGLLRLAPEGFLSRTRKFFGAQDIQVCDPPFDEQFMIQGSPEPWVQMALTPEVRAVIMDLAKLGGTKTDPTLRIELGPTGLTIRVGRDLVGRAGVLERFVERAATLLRKLREHEEGGIRILPAEEVAAQGKCPVCSEEIGDSFMRCLRCRTPHHRDCWDYFGGCAIYACSSHHGQRERERER